MNWQRVVISAGVILAAALMYKVGLIMAVLELCYNWQRVLISSVGAIIAAASIYKVELVLTRVGSMKYDVCIPPPNHNNKEQQQQ